MKHVAFTAYLKCYHYHGLNDYKYMSLILGFMILFP